MEPAFEVASVKPSQLDTNVWRWNGQTLVATATTVEGMILLAYQSAPHQVLGGPDWMREERFEIRATAPPPAPGASLAPMDRQLRVFPMMRNLLAERFQLRVREESQSLPRYVLLPRDNGGGQARGMRPADPACEAVRAAAQQNPSPPTGAPPVRRCGIWFQTTSQGLMTFSAGATSMSELVAALRPFLDRPLVDQSGIKGYFGLELTFGIDQTPVRAPLSTEPPRGPGGPSIAEALADDMNLKLRSDEGPVPVIVVEHVERPTPN